MNGFRRAGLGLALLAAGAAGAQDRGAAALDPLVKGLGTSARVLMIGAHPDDEDTQLIAFLARGRHVRTAYLSLTRGDGGQNLIGNELGEALGVIRTEELLAARRVDGGEQYFTRAFDFGFSKSADETLERWGHDVVLGDVVTVVRAFRPHVIVSVFSGTPRDGHGHHQAAGRLAREAFDAAADTARFPAQRHGRAWTPAKFYRRASRFNDPNPDTTATLRLNVGEYSPVLGRSYAEVAAESRSQHRSQGFGTLQPKGARWAYVAREATRAGPEDARAERSLFDGVDTTLARLRRPGQAPGLAAVLDSLAPAAARVQGAYRADDPAAAVTPLAALTALAARATAVAGATARGAPATDPDVSRSVEDLWRRSQDALLLAAGVAVEGTAARETVAQATAAGSADTLAVAVTVYNRGRAPVEVELLTLPAARDARAEPRASVAPDSAWRGTVSGTPWFVTAPWWRAGGRIGDVFAADVDGRTEQEIQASNASGALRVTARLRVAGAQAFVGVPVVQRVADPVRGEVQRPVAVVPGITVWLDRAVEYARAGVRLERPLRVTVRSAFAADTAVDVALTLPAGITADSARRRVRVPANATREVVFRLRGTPKPGRYQVAATASAGGEVYRAGAVTLAYEHIAPQRLYYYAATRVQAVDVALPPRPNVGYVAGVGDNVAPMLTQLGIPVTRIDPSALASPNADLSQFSAVVVGPRAYEAHPALLAANAKLLAYARGGGTVVAQYGQYEMTQPGVLPYPITLARPAQRVTLEDAPVRVLEPAAGVLTTPNRIGGGDFEGWVQERALYMPQSFDPRYRAALEMHDPGEPPNRGALLVAPVGRGTYVYTTLALFRQLPAGNPGAARLFVNLLAATARPAPAPARAAP